MPTKPKRQPRALWTTIREAYVASDNASCQQLAELFNVRPWSVSSRCKREGWQALRERRQERSLPERDDPPPAAQIAQAKSEKCTNTLALTGDKPLQIVPEQLPTLSSPPPGMTPKLFNEQVQAQAVN